MFLCWFMFSWLFTFPVACHRFMHIQLASITSSTFNHVFQALYMNFLKADSSLAMESGSGWALEHCTAPVLVIKDNKCEVTWHHCVQRGVVCHPLGHLVSVSTTAWSFMVKVEGCSWWLQGVFQSSALSLYSVTRGWGRWWEWPVIFRRCSCVCRPSEGLTNCGTRSSFQLKDLVL